MSNIFARTCKFKYITPLLSTSLSHSHEGRDLEEFWLQERHKHGKRNARGNSLEAILPVIKQYARYYYQVIFQEMAKGEIQQLQHRFRSLVRGCEAVYRERLKAEQEHKKR